MGLFTTDRVKMITETVYKNKVAGELSGHGFNANDLRQVQDLLAPAMSTKETTENQNGVNEHEIKEAVDRAKANPSIHRLDQKKIDVLNDVLHKNLQ